MQAFEGYLENGVFTPLRGNTLFTGKRKVIISFLDESNFAGKYEKRKTEIEKHKGTTINPSIN